MSKEKYFDESYAIHRPVGCIKNRSASSGAYGWTDGDVITQHGIVTVYAQGDENHDPLTRLDFCWKGRHYMRNFTNRKFTNRGLVTKANEFAADIVRRKP